MHIKVKNHAIGMTKGRVYQATAIVKNVAGVEQMFFIVYSDQGFWIQVPAFHVMPVDL